MPAQDGRGGAPERRPALEVFLDLFGRLRDADDRLQPIMRDLPKRYYSFLRAVRSSGRNGLLLCHEPDPQGRIRRLFWRKLDRERTPSRILNGRRVPYADRLNGPFRRWWIYRYGHTWPHRNEISLFAREAAYLTARRSEVALALRDLVFAFTYRWSRRATAEDRDRAAVLFAARFRPAPPARFLSAIAGVVAFARELAHVEEDLVRAVEGWGSDLPFGPAVRPNECGSLRLFWGSRRSAATRSGRRIFTDYIRGWPTDRWMRSEHIPLDVRLKVRAATRPLRALYRKYREPADVLAHWHERVRGILTRVEKLLAQIPLAPPAPRPVGAAAAPAHEVAASRPITKATPPDGRGGERDDAWLQASEEDLTLDCYDGDLGRAADLLPEIQDVRGSVEESLVFKIARNFLAWVADLPASERNHHARPWGLFDHSKKVALYAVQAAARRWPRNDLDRRSVRLRYAAWLKGLLHDAGKMMQLHVTNPEGEIWSPYQETLEGFYVRHGRDRCTWTWRPGRGWNAHVDETKYVVGRMLTPEVAAFLGPVILSEVLEASSPDAKAIDELVREADKRSAQEDEAAQASA